MTSRFHIEEFNSDEWSKTYAASARKICFGEEPKENELIDFAALCIDTSKQTPAGYMTCKDISKDELYLKHGGAFPSILGTTLSYVVYKELIEYAQSSYKRLSTLVQNTNTAYLKMALTIGFLPIGIEVFNNGVYVKLFREV